SNELGIAEAGRKFEDFTAETLGRLRYMVDQSNTIYQDDTRNYLENLNAKNAADEARLTQKQEREQLLADSVAELEAQRREQEIAQKQLYADENYLFLEQNLGREQALRELKAAEDL